MEPKDARTREELSTVVNNGGVPEYLFFWGHTPKDPRQADKSCLSNWFPAEFSENGVRYATTEHYMMAKKAELFRDDEALRQILAAPSPAEAKKLGRTVRNFDDGIWKRDCFEIVVRANLAKFSQNDALGAFLRNTGSQVLVEASPHDQIWGIGLGQENPNALNPATWRGQNLLGFALMEVRERLGISKNAVRKLGLYGGTFDPIHHGHLIQAREALEHLQLDRLYFIPTATSPHKLDRRHTPAGLRYAMVEAAIQGERGFAVSDLETRREGPSYTIDTVEHFRKQFPDTQLYYLIGEDNLPELHTWRQIERLRELVQFAVLNRGPLESAEFPTVAQGIFDISASQIRRRVAEGRSIQYLVPESVRAMIVENNLYKE